MDSIMTYLGVFAGSSVLTALVSGWVNKRKTNADAAQVTTTTILQWANSLTSRIELLEKREAEKDRIISELRVKIAHLEAEVEERRKGRHEPPAS